MHCVTDMSGSSEPNVHCSQSKCTWVFVPCSSASFLPLFVSTLVAFSSLVLPEFVLSCIHQNSLVAGARNQIHKAQGTYLDVTHSLEPSPAEPTADQPAPIQQTGNKCLLLQALLQQQDWLILFPDPKNLLIRMVINQLPNHWECKHDYDDGFK